MAVRFHIHGAGQFDRAHPVGPCVWPNFDLLTLESGWLRLKLLDSDVVELRRGQSILIYPRTRFSGQSVSKQCAVFVQHFGLSDVGNALGHDHPLGRLAGRSKGYELFVSNHDRHLMSDIRRAVRLAGKAGVNQILREALLTLILGQLSMAPLTGTQHDTDGGTLDLPDMLQWVTANLQKQISLDLLAERAGYSTSHFRASFRRQMQQTPGAFVRQCRHVEAARLLRETQTPIKEIARRVGYEDLAHFYRFFTTISTLTPGEYRARHQPRG